MFREPDLARDLRFAAFTGLGNVTKGTAHSSVSGWRGLQQRAVCRMPSDVSKQRVTFIPKRQVANSKRPQVTSAKIGLL